MKKLLIVSLAATSLIACGKHSSNNPFKNAGANAKARELSGEFDSKCNTASAGDWIASGLANFNAGEMVKSQKVSYTFPKGGVGEKITRTETMYTGSNCEPDTKAYAFEERGNYKVGQRTSQPGELRHLDATFNEVRVSIFKESAANAANSFKLCGRKDWKPDTKDQDVKGSARDTSCYDASYNDQGERPVALSYRMDGNKLFLSDTKKTVSSSDRTTAQSKTTQFTKQ